MSITNADVEALLKHADKVGLKPQPQKRGWGHMGAVLADASLQAGINYATVVEPRVRRLIDEWPDATTTSAFVARSQTDDVAATLRFKPDSKKMRTLRDLTDFMHEEGVETPEALAVELLDEGFLGRLRRVKGVGPKTVDYLSILTGSHDHVAVDSQIKAFVREAGCAAVTYKDVREIVVRAAAERGWTAGSLDAAIWKYRSTR
ncbi:hypothetical protein [Arsenicicoccus bolidensis]|nr:hypothetical protein [Arsenicicoccus bolidensis]